MSYRQGNTELLQQDVYTLKGKLTFIGLVAMIDLPRPEVSVAIALYPPLVLIAEKVRKRMTA